MALYEVNHVIPTPGPVSTIAIPGQAQAEVAADRDVLRPGEKYTDDQLRNLGFTNLDHLLAQKPGGFSAALAIVPGTEGVPSEYLTRMAPANPEIVAKAEAARLEAEKAEETKAKAAADKAAADKAAADKAAADKK